jgi:hypothetical protein
MLVNVRVTCLSYHAASFRPRISLLRDRTEFTWEAEDPVRTRGTEGSER